jgi:hypothetical protein
MYIVIILVCVLIFAFSEKIATKIASFFKKNSDSKTEN